MDLRGYPGIAQQTAQVSSHFLAVWHTAQLISKVRDNYHVYPVVLVKYPLGLVKGDEHTRLLTLPGVPTESHSSVAGAISANVNGKDAWKTGSFAEQVVRLKLLTADGTIHDNRAPDYDDWTSTWTWSRSSFAFNALGQPARVALRYVGRNGAQVGHAAESIHRKSPSTG